MHLDPSEIEHASEYDSWDSEAFEDHVARSIIGLYETPSGYSKQWRASDWTATERDIQLVKNAGLFIPQPGRIALAKEMDRPLGSVYKRVFCHSLHQTSRPKTEEEKMYGLDKIYQSFQAIRREPKLPQGWRRTALGDLYSLVDLFAQDGKLWGIKQFFACNGTRISSCIGNCADRWETTRRQVTTMTNFQIDRAYTWSIHSKDSEIDVTIGCTNEEVKSLLYARSLPLTASGRKRPILHLVHSHRRRMREGVEIDIAQFLRGTKKVEMDGVIFEVMAPAVELEKMDAAKAA